MTDRGFTILGVTEHGSWRSIEFAHPYEVDDLGNVRRKVNAGHPERRQYIEIKPQVDKDGYAYLRLHGHKWLVHRLVYVVFRGRLIDGCVICHLDGDRRNNSPANLLQSTQKTNIAHKIGHGTHQVGEKHARNRYLDETVRSTFKYVAELPRSRTGRLRRGSAIQLVAESGIDLTLIYNVSCGRRAHV